LGASGHHAVVAAPCRHVVLVPPPFLAPLPLHSSAPRIPLAFLCRLAPQLVLFLQVDPSKEGSGEKEQWVGGDKGEVVAAGEPVAVGGTAGK